MFRTLSGVVRWALALFVVLVGCTQTFIYMAHSADSEEHSVHVETSPCHDYFLHRTRSGLIQHLSSLVLFISLHYHDAPIRPIEQLRMCFC